MDIESLRRKIDSIDDEILRLLNERMVYVNHVGEIKTKVGGAIYRPEREQAIINRLVEKSKEQNGALDRRAIEAIFYEIIGVAKDLDGTWSCQRRRKLKCRIW